MGFKEAEERFYELKGRLDAGAISQEEFKAQLEGLKVQDSQGRYWMIGVQSGKWYFYDGTRWVRAEPPGEAGEAPPSEETPRGPVASLPEQPLKPPTSLKLRPRRRGISGGLLALIPLGLILACCLSIVAVGTADYLISSHPISSALSDLLGRQIGFMATPTPTLRWEGSPIPTLSATPAPSPTTPAKVEMTAYHRESLGLSLDYPTDWQVTEAENEVFFSPAGVGLEILGEPAFGVGVYSGEADSVQGIIDEWLAPLPEDAEVSPTTEVATPSHAWQMVEASFVDPYVGKPKQSYYGTTVWEGTLYIFISESPPEQWATYEPIFFQMILSIELTGPAPQPTTTVAPTATPIAVPTPTLLPTPTAISPPTLSGRIAFTVYEAGGYETYVANIDGSGLQKIWSRMHQPDFNPSGTQLAASGELPNHLTLQRIAINPDNTAGKHWKVSTNYEDSWPSWSPDGSRIVYVFFKEELPDWWRLRILSDLSKATQGGGINGPGGMKVRGRYTVWTGDNRIAFTGCDYWGAGSNCGIYTIGAGGGDATRISDGSQDRATDGFGNQVLYISPADGDWEIYKVASTGGSPAKLTDNSAQDGLATWSPDGQHIAFLTDRSGAWEIWVMNADGTGKRKLFSLPGVPGPQWTEERISWGP